MAELRIGTSGWHYEHWRGTFYPPGERPSLGHYAESFDTVEINSSFYRLPSPETFAQWRDQTPKDFVFAVKASRFITHMKKLSDPIDSFEKFFAAIVRLGPKLGPILFQLPPHWRRDADRLDNFLKPLGPKRLRCAFEFRNETWFCPEVHALLARHNAAHCIFDIARRVSPSPITADFVYVRLHGPEAAAYAGSYSDRALAAWAARIDAWLREGRDVYCYFDNDQEAYAVRDALRLKAMTGERRARAASAQRSHRKTC